jgi:hypothetical protein
MDMQGDASTSMGPALGRTGDGDLRSRHSPQYTAKGATDLFESLGIAKVSLLAPKGPSIVLTDCRPAGVKLTLSRRCRTAVVDPKATLSRSAFGRTTLWLQSITPARFAEPSRP